MASTVHPSPAAEAVANGQPAPLSMRVKLSFASGEVASNLAWNMVAGFLLFYYSDVAMLPVAMLGTLMLTARVLDAIFDPLVGLLVDRTQTRFGRARPYLLAMPIPFMALCIATFAVPHVSLSLKIAYAYGTFVLLGLAYSLLYIPYCAMLPMMTREPDEKLQLGSFRAMGTSIASIFVYSLTKPLVGLIGGPDAWTGFVGTAAVMAGVTAILYFVTFANCRERYDRPAGQARQPIRASYGQMLRNPIWQIGFFAGLLTFIRLGVMVSTTAYFTKYVLDRPEAISIILPMLSVAILSGGFLSRYLFRRVGKRKGNLIAYGCALVALTILPFLQSHLVPFIIVFILANVVGGIQGATNFILMADAVDLHETMFGVRAEGLLVSSVSFGMKVGMAIGAAITAYALALAGYDPAHVSAGAKRMIAMLFYGGPILASLLLMLNISRYRMADT